MRRFINLFGYLVGILLISACGQNPATRTSEITFETQSESYQPLEVDNRSASTELADEAVLYFIYEYY